MAMAVQSFHLVFSLSSEASHSDSPLLQRSFYHSVGQSFSTCCHILRVTINLDVQMPLLFNLRNGSIIGDRALMRAKSPKTSARQEIIYRSRMCILSWIHCVLKDSFERTGGHSAQVHKANRWCSNSIFRSCPSHYLCRRWTACRNIIRASLCKCHECHYSIIFAGAVSWEKQLLATLSIIRI